MRLFLAEISSQEVNILESESDHILKVLRMKEGEEIYLTDGKGSLLRGNLVIVGKRAKITNEEFISLEKASPNYLHIAIAPTKNIDRFEFFIEKAVELGISEITPILCRNSERKSLNQEKINKQMIAACKQSQRIHFPVVNELTNLNTFLSHLSPQLTKNTFVAHCYKDILRIDFKEVINKSIFDNKNDIKKESCYLIGPEGDFSKDEIEKISSLGIKGINLGNSRLRTETSGIYICSAYHLIGN